MIETTQNDDRCIEKPEMGQVAYYAFSISNLCQELGRIYVTNLAYRRRQKSTNASKRWDSANRISTGFISGCIAVVYGWEYSGSVVVRIRSSSTFFLTVTSEYNRIPLY